ncbi:MAG: response regulator [Desulfuromonadaceae bacterium]|nr:response regulator [Desulfuromonadaceae bacterium]
MADEEQKQLEQKILQEQKMANLGILACGIVHDFNNILSVITGSTSLARLETEVTDKYLFTIDQAAERGAGLCRQILAYAGKASFSMSEIDLLALVDDVVNMLKSTLPMNVEISFVNSVNGALIIGDTNQLGQIVMNLIINASEAIGTKYGEIIVALASKDIRSGQPEIDHFGNVIPPKKYACLEVSDNGCGMDDETRQKIFEPFYTTKIMGRGLGMSALLGIISAHEGTLQLSSKLGEGTSFKVYLPMLEGESVSIRTTPQTSSSLPWQSSGTILLVEDSEQLRTMAKSMLDVLGFTVIEAANGREALDIYKKDAADICLVLTDVNMPIMDGYELFNELKKINQELPVIISSGYGETAVTSRIEREKISGLLKKPYSLNQLKDVLKDVVEKAFLNQVYEAERLQKIKPMLRCHVSDMTTII